jgi:hypothetical protein
MTKNAWVAMVILKTQGMSTPGRARKLGIDLRKLKGISVVDFNYITDTVSIMYDSNKLTLDTIRNTLEGSSPKRTP